MTFETSEAFLRETMVLFEAGSYVCAKQYMPARISKAFPGFIRVYDVRTGQPCGVPGLLRLIFSSLWLRATCGRTIKVLDTDSSVVSTDSRSEL